MKALKQLKLEMKRTDLELLEARGWKMSELKKVMFREKRYGQKDEDIVNALLNSSKVDAQKGYSVVDSECIMGKRKVIKTKGFVAFSDDESAAKAANKDGLKIDFDNLDEFENTFGIREYLIIE